MSYSNNVQYHMVIVALIHCTLNCTLEKYPILMQVNFTEATIPNTIIHVTPYPGHGAIISNARICGLDCIALLKWAVFFNRSNIQLHSTGITKARVLTMNTLLQLTFNS